MANCHQFGFDTSEVTGGETKILRTNPQWFWIVGHPADHPTYMHKGWFCDISCAGSFFKSPGQWFSQFWL